MTLRGLAYIRCRPAPVFFFFRQGRDCRSPALQGGAAPAFPGEAGTSAFGNRARGSTSKMWFKGFGVLPQQAETDFWRSRRKSVSSVCGNKRTACQVAQKTFSPAFFNLCSSGNCRFRASVLQKFIACICYSKNLPFCIYLGNKSRLEQIIQSSYPFGTLLLTDFSIHHGRTSLN